jgi:hypothetical protein
MTTHHIKAGVRLRKTKRTLQRKHERFKQALVTKLAMLDDELHSASQNHSFLHNSVMTLAADELDTEFWLSGARAHYRWLQRSDKRIADQLQQIRQWVNQ